MNFCLAYFVNKVDMVDVNSPAYSKIKIYSFELCSSNLINLSNRIKVTEQSRSNNMNYNLASNENFGLITSVYFYISMT